MADRDDQGKPSDAQLINAYLAGNESSFEMLVTRYYPMVYRRLLQKTGNEKMIAEELAQDCWLKVAQSLPDYEDSNKFSHWLNTLVTNVLKDHWRAQSSRIKSVDYGEDGMDSGQFADPTPPPEHSAIRAEEVRHLTTVLIPELSVEHRMVFLLLFESTLWDNAQPLEWNHLAGLNGINIDEAWRRFESARKELMSGKNAADIDREELLIFLVWTQAKRASKSGKYTMKYFADLLGEPEQNLKNRNHAAQKQIRDRLAEYQGVPA